MGSHGLLVQAAAPVGGGKAWPGFDIDQSEPSGSRVAISRAGRRPRAHHAARPSNADPSGARKTVGAHSNKHNSGGASPRPAPPLKPLHEEPSHATRLQLGALEAKDVEELARTIR